MFNAILTKIVGSKNERDLKRLAPIVQRINELEPEMQRLSDVQLAELTPKFRRRLADGESLDDLLPEAFAAVREAGRRIAEHAPLRCAADRRHGSAPGEDRRDEDR